MEQRKNIVAACERAAPSPWVVRFIGLLTDGGETLDLACGAGRHTALLVNEMIGAGFAVTGVEEPRPSAEDCKGRDWLGFWRTQAALYLFLKGVNPAER